MLLLWGRFAVSQTIIPEAKEHFLTQSAPRDTHLFGGLGVRNGLANLVGLGRKARFELLEVRSQLLPRYDEAVSRSVHSTNEVRHDSG